MADGASSLGIEVETEVETAIDVLSAMVKFTKTSHD